MLFLNEKESKNDKKYRYEYKYEIDVHQMIILKERLSRIMEKDVHVGGRESYRIRSLYFDDYDNTGYYDNENGYDFREKFRIRIYNGKLDKIRLELKRKESGKNIKYSCVLNQHQMEMLLRGEYLQMEDKMPALLKKFCILQQTRNLAPKVIVEYDRIPFVCIEGNVRVTLDLDISASDRIENFLEKEIVRRPIMPIGKHLLEVKYNEFIPDYINRTIAMEHLINTAYSKYYLCRKFGGIV